jgi:uncharacterized Zn-binding protein involved in type VI secretion
MPNQGRVGDKSQVPADGHGCPSCPHPCIGPATGGSPDVFVNGKPALRVGDPGVHAACCGPNTWTAAKGAPAVYFNGKKAHRLGDAVNHCGGNGKLVEGSPNVYVGDASGGSPEAPIKTFEGAFILTCEVTGVILKEVDYEVTTASGKKVSGRTDEQGRTKLVETEKIEKLEVFVPDPEGSCGEG